MTTKKCMVEVYSSRMCERGTKSCTVVHGMSSDSLPMTGPGPFSGDSIMNVIWYRLVWCFQREIGADK